MIVEGGGGAAAGDDGTTASGDATAATSSAGAGGACEPYGFVLKPKTPGVLEDPICGGPERELYDSLLECGCIECANACVQSDEFDLCFQDGHHTSGPCDTCLEEQCFAEVAACEAGAES